MNQEIIEKTILPNLDWFVKNPKLGLAEYGLTYEDGSFQYAAWPPCHYALCKSMTNLSKGNCTSIINEWQFKEPCTRSIAKAYYNWLINDSPFADAFLIKDIDLLEKSKAIVGNVEAPADYVGGAMIATRFPLEYPYQCLYWYKLVEAGANPTIAFDLCHFVRGVTSQQFTISSYGTPHASHTNGWVSFIRKSYSKCAVSFVKNAGYTSGGIVTVWHEGDRNKQLKDFKTYLNRGMKKTENNNPFSAAATATTKYNWEQTFPHFLEFIQQIEDTYVRV